MTLSAPLRMHGSPAPVALPALLAVLAGLVIGCAPAEPGRPNIVLIVLDTVRADRLSSYGHTSPTTPRLDSFAKAAIRYTNASSTSSWTLPAHASLFTGLAPIDHRATQENLHLDEGPATLAEILGASGYTTLGVSGNVVVSRDSGLARGFDGWAETWRDALRSSAGALHPNVFAAGRLLEDVPADSPWLLFVNYIEAHRPYAPPAELRARFRPPNVSDDDVLQAARRSPASFYLEPESVSESELEAMRGLYDAGLADVDARAGELLDMLESAGRLDDAIVIITSDHGENLGDHGHIDHVFSLYRSTTHVPLLIRLPGGQRGGEVRSESVSLVDVFATVLARAGVAPPADARRLGRDLLAADLPGSDAPVYSEYYYPYQVLAAYSPELRDKDASRLAPYLRRLRAVERAGLRFIWSSDGRHELYDVASDPNESRNRLADATLAEAARTLQQDLQARIAAAGGGPPRPARSDRRPPPALGDFDREARRQLEALGYLPASGSK